jgi:uncharacterized protein YndB with AHSA1/START domain
VLTKGNPLELKITRLYNASLSSVWAAWTNPHQLDQWWGPRNTNTVTKSHEFAVDGFWLFTMRTADGLEFPNKIVFSEIEDRKRLVYSHGAPDNHEPHFRTQALFSEVGRQTQLELTMTFPTVEAAEESIRAIKEYQGNTTWDRLAEYLEKQASGKEIFVISRSFNVGLHAMFKAWTNPEQLVAWSGPVGAQLEYINVDIRAGGKAFYRMPFGDDVMYGTVQYLQVLHPHRLVYVQQFADEQGNPARHPLAPTWPQNMLTTITFTEEKQGGTRVTLQWEVTGDWSQSELETFLMGRSSMSQGWSGSLDKLEEFFES